MAHCVAVPTNLEINDRLLAKARRIGGHKTKKATVNEALAEYIQRREQRDVSRLFGSVVFEPGFDYKVDRAKR